MISYVTPSGSSLGGNAYLITGSGFVSEAYNDEFDGAVLDALLWSDISTGSGSITTDYPHLYLDTSSTNTSLAGIESANTFTDVQFEIKSYLYALSSYPSVDINALSFMLYVDASNFARIKVNIAAYTAEVTLVCDIYVGGALISSYSEDWTLGYSTFKIARSGSTIYFSANGDLFYSSRDFIASAATFRILNDNSTIDYQAKALVDYFTERTFVKFDDQCDLNTIVVSDTRIRGIVPASLDDKEQVGGFAGTVDVDVTNAVGTSTSNDAYEYIYDNMLKLVNSSQSSFVLSLIGDEQIKTPSGSSRSLGGGR